MPKPLKNVEATIRKVAQDSARVFMSNHVQEKMEERGISLTQVLKCLCYGVFVEGPVLDSFKQLGWKSTMQNLSAGTRVEVVSKLIEKDDGFIVVITTYERGS